jgi:hypothetical protein
MREDVLNSGALVWIETYYPTHTDVLAVVLKVDTDVQFSVGHLGKITQWQHGAGAAALTVLCVKENTTKQMICYLDDITEGRRNLIAYGLHEKSSSLIQRI